MPASRGGNTGRLPTGDSRGCHWLTRPAPNGPRQNRDGRAPLAHSLETLAMLPPKPKRLVATAKTPSPGSDQSPTLDTYGPPAVLVPMGTAAVPPLATPD